MSTLCIIQAYDLSTGTHKISITKNHDITDETTPFITPFESLKNAMGSKPFSDSVDLIWPEIRKKKAWLETKPNIEV